MIIFKFLCIDVYMGPVTLPLACNPALTLVDLS